MWKLLERWQDEWECGWTYDNEHPDIHATWYRAWEGKTHDGKDETEEGETEYGCLDQGFMFGDRFNGKMHVGDVQVEVLT